MNNEGGYQNEGYFLNFLTLSMESIQQPSRTGYRCSSSSLADAKQTKIPPFVKLTLAWGDR